MCKIVTIKCKYCKQDSLYISRNLSLCGECYGVLLRHGDSLTWKKEDGDGSGSSYRERYLSVRPMTYNINTVKKLPEGFKHLGNPLAAYKYCFEILGGPSEMLEEAILSDYSIALRYHQVLHKGKLEGLHPKLLQVEEEIRSQIGDGSLDDIRQYIHTGVIHGLKEDFFKEGYNLLTEHPHEIYSLSRRLKSRIPKREHVLVHSYETASYYARSEYFSSLGGNRFYKFETFLNHIYDKYYSEELNGYDYNKIKEDYGHVIPVFPDVISKVLDSFSEDGASLSEDELKEMQRRVEKYKEVDEYKNRKEDNGSVRRRWILGRALLTSLQSSGGSVAEYILEFKNEVWSEAETLFTSAETSVISYCIDIKKNRLKSIENNSLLTNTSKCVNYIKGLSPYPEVKNFDTIENYIVSELKHVDPNLWMKNKDNLYIIIKHLISKSSIGEITLGSDFLDLISKSASLGILYATSHKTAFKKAEPAIFKSSTAREEYTKLLRTLKE